MNTNNIIKLFVLVFALSFMLTGCTKKTENDAASDKTTQTGNDNLVEENSLQESDEDLATVDYKIFYDELSAKGEWVEVDSKELGFISGYTKFASDLDNKESFLSKVFGVKTANAEMQDNVDAGAFFVWRPAPELAVNINAGDQSGKQPVYMPYSNGQWVNTDAGWYFKAPTPAEEITSHYGRWAFNEKLGYVWVPGRVWAPAWVDWRVNDDYVAWTPIPPHTYITNNTIVIPPMLDDENRYVIVEKKNFVEPQLYKYMYHENKNKIMIKEMRKVDGVMVVNKTVINKGPDVTIIEKMLGKPVERVTINKVEDRDNVKYTSNTYTVYAPKLKKIKGEKTKGPISRPNKVVKFNEVTSAGTQEMNKKEEKQMEKEMKKEEKENRKDAKENEKQIKKEGKEQDKEIRKENKEQEKGKENKDPKKEQEKKKNDDGKNDKDKNKGNDKSGKDNGNKNKEKK